MNILLVDNDEDFRHGLAENLRDDSHQVLECSCPAEVPLGQVAALDLAISDYSMPGEDGLVLAHRLHQLHPALPVMLVTSYSAPPVREAVAASRFISLLHKPVDFEEIQHFITELQRTERH